MEYYLITCKIRVCIMLSDRHFINNYEYKIIYLKTIFSLN